MATTESSANERIRGDPKAQGGLAEAPKSVKKAGLRVYRAVSVGLCVYVCLRVLLVDWVPVSDEWAPIPWGVHPPSFLGRVKRERCVVRAEQSRSSRLPECGSGAPETLK